MKKKISNKLIYGVDLGSTSGVIAQVEQTGIPQLLRDPETGHYHSPTDLLFSEDGSILFGTEAKRMGALYPERHFSNYKRKIGDELSLGVVDGVTITPERCYLEAVNAVVRQLKDWSGFVEEQPQVVVAVPAQFNEKQRQIVKSAFEKAGAVVLGLVPEPSAIAYSFRVLNPYGDHNLFVYDFGGGTLDCSVVSLQGSRTEVLGTSGDTELGGIEVDRLVASRILAAFRNEHQIELDPKLDGADLFQIWESAEQGKIGLSKREKVKIYARAQSKRLELIYNRDDLRNDSSALMHRAEEVTNQALSAAGVRAEDITGVLLGGGSSYLPVCRELMASVFGAEKILDGGINPIEAIALGAAVLATHRVTEAGAEVVDDDHRAIPLPQIDPSDIMPVGLGVAAYAKGTDKCICSIILPAGIPLPCEEEAFFGSKLPEQTGFDVRVVQGADEQPLDECILVAEDSLTLPARDPSQKSIRVSMRYDLSGMADVVVEDLVSKKTTNITCDFTKAEKAGAGQ